MRPTVVMAALCFLALPMMQVFGFPGAHAGDSEDPIPLRPGETHEGEIAEPTPHLGDWLAYMAAPFPFPNSVVYSAVPEQDGVYVIQARSLDFDAGLRLSRVMPDGEVIPVQFNNDGCVEEPGEIGFTDSEMRPLLRAGWEYRIEVMHGAQPMWPAQYGRFKLVYRRATAPEGLEPPWWEEEFGVKGRPLWWYKLAHLRKVADRTREIGHEPRESFALRLLANQLLAAARPPEFALAAGRHDHLASFDEIHGIIDRLEELAERTPLARLGLDPILRRYYRFTGRDDEAEALAFAGSGWDRGIDPLRRLRSIDELVARARADLNSYQLFDALKGRIQLHLSASRNLKKPLDEETQSAYRRAMLSPEEVKSTLGEIEQILDEMPIGAVSFRSTWLEIQAGLRRLDGEPEAARKLVEEARVLTGSQLDSVEKGLRKAEDPVGLMRLLWEKAGWLGFSPESKALMEEHLEVARNGLPEGDPRLAFAVIEARWRGSGGPRAETISAYAEDCDEAIGLLSNTYGPDWMMKVPTYIWRWRVLAQQTCQEAMVGTGQLLEPLRLTDEGRKRVEDEYGSYDWSFSSRAAALQAGILTKVRLYEEAIPLLERGLEMQRVVGWPSLAQEFYVLDALVPSLIETGEAARALEIATHAVDRQRERSSQLGTEVGVAAMLGFQASALTALGRYDEAIRDLEKSLTIVGDMKGGSADIHRCNGNTGLSEVQLSEGRPARAEAHLEAALVNCTAFYGPDSPEVQRLKQLKPLILAELGDGSAMDAAVEGQLDRSRKLRLLSHAFSEKVALRASTRRSWAIRDLAPPSGLDIALSLLTGSGRSTAPPADSRAAALDAIVQSRALVLEGVGSRNRLLKETSDPASAALHRRYKDAARRASNLVASGRDRGPVMEAVLKELEESERELARTSLRFRKERAGRTATLSEVKSYLPPGAALVSFRKFQKIEFHPAGDNESREPLRERVSPHYAALLLRGGEPAPEIIDLGAAAEVDAAVDGWERALERDQATLRGMGMVVASSPGGAVETSPGEAGSSNQKWNPPLAGNSFRDRGEMLRKLVWDPVASRLAGIDRIFIVPDGGLNLLSFAALPIGKTRWLLETGPVMHYLSAERDLVREGGQEEQAVPSAHPSSRSLLALAGIDYEAPSVFAKLRSAEEPGSQQVGEAPDVPRSVDSVVASGDLGPGTPPWDATSSIRFQQSGRADAAGWGGGIGTGAAGASASMDTGPAGATVAMFRGERSECAAFAEESFSRLGATGSEAEAIVRLWESAESLSSTSRSPGDPQGSATLPRGSSPRAVLLEGATATETAFKLLAPEASIVHLATHGFFLDGRCRSALDDTRGMGGVITAENPLVLSGLALAGANNRQHASPDEDDGILTAQEIAAMDLTSVEWAVLSACETGVGEIKAGEGVFGLRRAFQVAGADTLIMSLWSVEDVATRAWMKALYEGRLLQKMSTADAVHHASLTVLNDRKSRGLSDHPFYWAAFVAAGNWE